MRRTDKAPPAVLILGTADWDAEIATNQHYVSTAIAAQNDVVFVEGFGTRSPRLNKADLRRALRRWSPNPAGAHRAIPSGLLVTSPRMIPWHAGPPAAINHRTLWRQVPGWLASTGVKVLWTYTPYTYGLEAVADVVVYHLVDLIHENPDVNRARFLSAERHLASACTWALATSEPIGEHLADVGVQDVRVRHNVGDVDPFFAASEALDAEATRAGIIFIGVLAPWKLDTKLLLELAEAAEGRVPITLVGPIPSGSESLSVWRLLRARGVEIARSPGRSDLARRVASARVGIVPYQTNPLTRGMSPLKIYEYLAAGLPVIATPLPSISPVAGAIYVRAGGDFVELALKMTEMPDSPDQRKGLQALARANNWVGRGLEIRTMLAASVEQVERGRSAF